MHRHNLLNLLQQYLQQWPEESSVVKRFEKLLTNHERCFERDCWAGHITGSAWLVNAAGTHVLLTHHRKLGRWLQLGGHSDGDTNTQQAARREAEEESGLKVAALGDVPLDIDVHLIPARRNDPEHHHYDVRYVFKVVGTEEFTVSEESIDLAWVLIAEIARFTEEESVLRMARKWMRTHADNASV